MSICISLQPLDTTAKSKGVSLDEVEDVEEEEGRMMMIHDQSYLEQQQATIEG